MSDEKKKKKIVPAFGADFWRVVRAEWEAGGNSEVLAKKFGCSPQAIRNKLKAQGWRLEHDPNRDYLKWLTPLENICKNYPAGRVDPMKWARVMSAIEIGMSRTAACQLVQLDLPTLKRWEREAPGFENTLAAAARLFQMANLQRVDGAAKRDWHAAKWLLETNPTTREEVRPAADEKKVVIEFSFKRDDFANPLEITDYEATALLPPDPKKEPDV